MALDKKFQEYFSALDRAGGEDRCYLCRRTAKEVKHFFGFDEDGEPFDIELFGLEDVSLSEVDIMSYRGRRPVCAVCQLNVDAIAALAVLERSHSTVKGNKAAVKAARAASATKAMNLVTKG